MRGTLSLTNQTCLNFLQLFQTSYHIQNSLRKLTFLIVKAKYTLTCKYCLALEGIDIVWFDDEAKLQQINHFQ